MVRRAPALALALSRALSRSLSRSLSLSLALSLALSRALSRSLSLSLARSVCLSVCLSLSLGVRRIKRHIESGLLLKRFRRHTDLYSAFESHDCTSQNTLSPGSLKHVYWYQTIMYAYPKFFLQLQINRLGVSELSGLTCAQ